MLIVFSICIFDASGQRVPTENHTPRKALVRSLAVPGWGQMYNRQYYKIPIVYAGLGLLAYVAISTDSEYVLYRRAFQYKAWQEEVESGAAEANPFPELESEYLRLIDREGLSEISSSSLEPVRDSLRRNRDLAFLGIGVVYALSTLDAYVSAHLLDFDISDDLSLQIAPVSRGVGIRLYLD